MSNATLVVKQNDKVFKFPITWIENYFEEDEMYELYNQLFYSDDIIDWSNGYPEMDVYLNDDPSITSRVREESVVGMLLPTKHLGQLLFEKSEKVAI